MGGRSAGASFIDIIYAVVIYAVLISVIHSPVVFTGKSLIPSLYQMHGFVPEGVYERSGRTPVNTFNVDIATAAYYEFPVNRLAGDLYRQGELPLWNPYQAAGTPLAAQYSSRAFFPYQIIEDLSPYWAWDYFMLGRVFLAGLFTFLFMMSAGLSFGASVLGGAFYMFSGSFTWFINLEQYANSAFILPLLMYSSEMLSRAPAPFKEGRRAAVFASICVALTLLAGQPEAALYIFLLAAAYFLFRVVHLHGKSGLIRRCAKFIISFAAGLALSSPLLFIFLEFVGNSHHIHPAGGGIGTESLANWKTLFAIVTPTATEFPADPEMIRGVSLLSKAGEGFYRFLPIDGVWDTLGGYTGVLPIFLTLAGLILLLNSGTKGSRAFFLFFLSSALFIILKNLGIRPFVWLGALPLFDRVWSLRWAGPVWVFSSSIASAAGFQIMQGLATSGVTEVTEGGGAFRIKSHEAERPGSLRIKPALAALLSFAVISVVYVSVSFVPTVMMALRSSELFNPFMGLYVFPSLVSGSLVTLAVLAASFVVVFLSIRRGRLSWYPVLVLSAVELWWAVPRGYDSQWLIYKWAPFIIGIAAVVAAYRGRVRAGIITAVLFFTVSALLDILSPKGLPRRQDPFKRAPYIEFLKGREGREGMTGEAGGAGGGGGAGIMGINRAMGAYGALFPNYSSTAGIPDVHFVNSLVTAPYHYFRNNFLHSERVTEATESVLWFTGRPERSVSDSYGRASSVKDSPPEYDIIRRLSNYSLLGVKYIILPRDFSPALLSGPGFALIYDAEVRIYENRSALPRAFVVNGFERASNYTEAQNRVFGSGIRTSWGGAGGAGDKGFDPLKTAVLEEDPGIPSTEGKGMYGIGVKGYGGNSATFEVTADRDGVLVLSDVFYPGWKAFVNGERRKVMRVDGLFMGVVVNKGRSMVEFKYSPFSFKAGVVVSGAALALCAFAFVTDKKEREGRG